jgi:hypothetical protein
VPPNDAECFASEFDDQLEGGGVASSHAAMGELVATPLATLSIDGNIKTDRRVVGVNSFELFRI